MKTFSANTKNCAILLISTMGIVGCVGMSANQEQVGQQQLNVIEGVCIGRGYQEGTPQFTGCVYEVGTQIFGGPGTARPAPPGNCFGYCGPGGGSNSSTTGYQQGTHTYIINGKTVMCTTTGTITNCF